MFALSGSTFLAPAAAAVTPDNAFVFVAVNEFSIKIPVAPGSSVYLPDSGISSASYIVQFTAGGKVESYVQEPYCVLSELTAPRSPSCTSSMLWGIAVEARSGRYFCFSFALPAGGDWRPGSDSY